MKTLKVLQCIKQLKNVFNHYFNLLSHFILHFISHLREFWYTELSPVVRLAGVVSLKFIVDTDVLWIFDGQGKPLFRTLVSSLDMDSTVEDNSWVNAGQFWNASQEATTVIIDILLAGFPEEITLVIVAVVSDAVHSVVVVEPVVCSLWQCLWSRACNSKFSYKCLI